MEHPSTGIFKFVDTERVASSDIWRLFRIVSSITFQIASH